MAQIKSTRLQIRLLKRFVSKYCSGVQAEAARQLGCSKELVSGMIRGDYGISALTALKIERISGGELKAAAMSPDAEGLRSVLVS